MPTCEFHLSHLHYLNDVTSVVHGWAPLAEPLKRKVETSNIPHTRPDIQQLLSTFNVVQKRGNECSLIQIYGSLSHSNERGLLLPPFGVSIAVLLSIVVCNL